MVPDDAIDARRRGATIRHCSAWPSDERQIPTCEAVVTRGGDAAAVGTRGGCARWLRGGGGYAWHLCQHDGRVEECVDLSVAHQQVLARADPRPQQHKGEVHEVAVEQNGEGVGLGLGLGLGVGLRVGSGSGLGLRLEL